MTSRRFGSPARLAPFVLAAVLGAACGANPAPALPGEQPAHRPPTRALNSLRTQLRQIFGAPIMERAVWGVVVRSLDTGETLYALNAGKLMMPASNMKIVTLAAAAEVLGWDHRFTTALESSAPLEDGVLRGDLFVRGTGDPTMNTREKRGAAVFAEWIGALRLAGIRRIEGRIIGDDQSFDDEGLGDGWSWDYLQYGYAAPVGALQFNENVAQLTIAPATRPGEPAIVTLPAGTGFTLVNRTVTGPEGSEQTIDYRRQLYEPVLQVTGSLPAGGPILVRTVSVVNPTVFFAQSLKEALINGGVEVTGAAVDFDDVAQEFVADGERRVLVSTQSPALREMATVLMKVSQNLYAETFLKALGASRGGVGTTSGGRAVVRGVFDGWGVPRDSYVISDGSGLSRYNYVGAEMVAALLERMHRDSRHREPFKATLPIAGRDGTIGTRMRRGLAEGNAIAKTGSIANVRSLSGYVRTRDGEQLVFSILANDFTVPAQTVTWIADLAVEVLAGFSRR